MRKFTKPAAALSLAVAVQALAAGTAWCYEDGAPPGHTGGFGEPDCTVCHADNDRNVARGSLTLEERPPEVPGGRQVLVVVLEHPELRSGGFQLAIRTPDGEPAGSPVPVSDRTRIVNDGEQPYLQHAREGRQPEDDGRIRWRFEWSPPAAGEAVIHVAANAANDDLSALGDFVFTLEETLAGGTNGASSGKPAHPRAVRAPGNSCAPGAGALILRGEGLQPEPVGPAGLDGRRLLALGQGLVAGAFDGPESRPFEDLVRTASYCRADDTAARVDREADRSLSFYAFASRDGRVGRKGGGRRHPVRGDIRLVTDPGTVAGHRRR